MRRPARASWYRGPASAVATACVLACGARTPLELPLSESLVSAADAAADAPADTSADVSPDGTEPSEAAPPGDDSGPAVDAADDGGPDPGSILPPRPIAPLSTATVTSHVPFLRWELPPGDDGALVELCRDRACASPVNTFPGTGPGALAVGIAQGV